MKYLYSLIIILAFTCIGIESYFCITERLLPFHLEGAFSRAVFYFSFFTVLSTLALSLGCLFVIFKPHYQSSALAVLRINGIVGVIITGIVYNLVLRGMYQPNLLVLRITTEFLHVVIPVLGVIGWVFFDPHPVLTKRSVINSFIPPIIYLIYTFVRGAITGLYPYPILDINLIGYAQVLINVGAITACFIGFAFLLYWLDNCRLIKR